MIIKIIISHLQFHCEGVKCNLSNQCEITPRHQQISQSHHASGFLFVLPHPKHLPNCTGNGLRRHNEYMNHIYLLQFKWIHCQTLAVFLTCTGKTTHRHQLLPGHHCISPSSTSLPSVPYHKCSTSSKSFKIPKPKNTPSTILNQNTSHLRVHLRVFEWWLTYPYPNISQLPH